MNTINHADLLQLTRTSGDRFVSLYMPTELPGRETPQNSIRFRELLQTAETSLIKSGLSKPDARKFLAPAIELLERPLFWKTLNRGLAILLSDGGLRVWHLPQECEVRCVVGKRFYVTPLVGWFVEDAPYLVLAVSQNQVRLFQGSRYSLREEKVPRLPRSLRKALHYDHREGTFQVHSGQPQIKGKEGLVYTGQGGEADVAKDEIAAFFRVVDKAVSEFLHSRGEPLLFAGVDYLFPIYREHNHYSRLLPTHVSGNPDLLSPEELRQRAWPIIDSLFQKHRAAEVAKYWDLVDHAHASNRVEDIVAAAHAGAVETLFIDPKAHRLGTFDPHSEVVRIDDSPRHDSEDLVNLAVFEVFRHRGNVLPAASGNIPGGGVMAATYRYALPQASDQATSVSSGQQITA